MLTGRTRSSPDVKLDGSVHVQVHVDVDVNDSTFDERLVQRAHELVDVRAIAPQRHPERRHRHRVQRHAGTDPALARATTKDGGGTRIDFSPDRERQVAAVTGQNQLIRLRVSGGAAVEHCLQIIEAASIPLTHLDLEGKELRCWFTIAVVPDWGEVRKRLDNVLGDQVEFGEEGAVTMVGHGIGGSPGIINKARASAVGAGVPLNAVSVSPLRVTLWCDRPHVDNLVRALHKTFIE